MDTAEASVGNFQGSRGEGEMSRWNTGDLYGKKTILYDTVMADTCHYVFVKTQNVQCQD